MKFETARGFYGITPDVLGDGYCLFLSTTHKGYAMEIGTGALIRTDSMRLIDETTDQQVSSITASIVVNDLDIVEAPSILAKVKAHRLQWLNPSAKVEIKYPQYVSRVLFPTDPIFMEQFVNGNQRLITRPLREHSLPLTVVLAQRD